MSSGISGVMSALKAETLLGESQLFDQIKKLVAELTWNSEDGKFGFDNYFQSLVDAIDAIPKLELEDDVAPGTETTYTIELTQAAEHIVDECDRIFRRLNQFEGKLREADRKVDNQKAEFVAWYMLAAVTLFRDLDDIKLPMADIRKLAEAEFSRLMGGLDVALETMIEAVKIESGKVSQHKAAQKEKYNLGRDQANATWASTLPAFSNAVQSDTPSPLGEQVVDDDVPVQVKKTSVIGDTLRIMTSDPAPKATFVKTGDPQPVKIVEQDPDRHYNKFMEGEVPKSPRKKLIDLDDEEV